MSQLNASANSSIGKDTIYICQTCSHREKEFAVLNRNYKYCQKCGGVSIKATLVDSYNYISIPNVEAFSTLEKDATINE